MLQQPFSDSERDHINIKKHYNLTKKKLMQGAMLSCDKKTTIKQEVKITKRAL